jgi:membrane protease YdiL (CAAX protease family)
MEYNSQLQPAVPWTGRDVLLGLGLALLWIFFLIILSNLSQRNGWVIDSGVVVVIGTAGLLLPIWYLTIYKYGASWATLGLRGFQPGAIGLGCGLMLLSGLFNLVYSAFLALYGWQIQPDIDLLFEETKSPLLLFLGGVIVAPVVEEIFFRGFIFSGLRNRWEWKKAAVFSAGLFALAHLLPTSLLPIFILGVIFATLYQFSGSIWPAILMHMLTNTLALSAAYAISQGWLPAP